MEFAVSIQHPFTHPEMSKTGKRVCDNSLNETPNPSILVELYCINDRLTMYRETRLNQASGKSTGTPELRNRVMNIIIRNAEYSLYGLNWKEVISLFILICKILCYLSCKLL